MIALLLVSSLALGGPPYHTFDHRSVAQLNRLAEALPSTPQFRDWEIRFGRCLLTEQLDKAVCSYNAWWGPLAVGWVYTNKAWALDGRVWASRADVIVEHSIQSCLYSVDYEQALCGVSRWWGPVMVVAKKRPEGILTLTDEEFVRPQ